jgi:hypothetical protein
MAPDAAAAAGGKKRKRYLPHNVSAPLSLFLLSISIRFVFLCYFPLIFAETSEEGFVSITPWCARFFHHLRWWKRTSSFY